MPAIESPVLGIAGNAASGKDFVAGKFGERGFVVVSSSDILREKIAERGIQTNRQVQTEIANELRDKHGGDYFVRAALARALSLPIQRGVVISGLYSPAEGASIQNHEQGKLIVVQQHRVDDPRARYERLLQRQDGDRDQLSYEEFLSAYTRENSGSQNEANIADLAAMADYTVINDGNVTYLNEQLDTIIGDV